MSLTRTNVMPVHVFTNWVFLEKPVRFEGKSYAQNIVSFSPGIRIDIPGIEFGYDIETREFMYKKDGGEWTPMSKEE